MSFMGKYEATIIISLTSLVSAGILHFGGGVFEDLWIFTFLPLIGLIIDGARWFGRHVRRFIASLPPRKSLRPL